MRVSVMLLVIMLSVAAVHANTNIRFDLKGLLKGAPTGCNCGDAPTDCSSCKFGINDWPCAPRDCTFCKHGVNGLPCKSSGCETCQFGIKGWKCGKETTVTTCSARHSGTDGYEMSALYRVVQQADAGWTQHYWSSNVVDAATIEVWRTDDTGIPRNAFRFWPQNAADSQSRLAWYRDDLRGYSSISQAFANWSPTSQPWQTGVTSAVPVDRPLMIRVSRINADGVSSEVVVDYECVTENNFQSAAINAQSSKKRSVDEHQLAYKNVHTFATVGYAL